MLQKMHFCVFPGNLVLPFLCHQLLLLEVKAQLIKFCTKFQIKQVKFLQSQKKAAVQQNSATKLTAFFQKC